MKIVVCVLGWTGAEDEPPSGNPILAAHDAWAVGTAAAISGRIGSAVHVVCLGRRGDSLAVRRALAAGAASADHLAWSALGRPSPADIASAVTGHLATVGFDLILAGRGALDAHAGAVLGLIASRLDLPLVANADGLELDREGVTARVLTRAGSESVRLPLPSMISLRNGAAPPPIAPLRDLIGATEKPVTLVETSLSVETSLAGSLAAPDTTPTEPSAISTPRRLSGHPGEMVTALVDELTRAGILPQLRP